MLILCEVATKLSIGHSSFVMGGAKRRLFFAMQSVSEQVLVLHLLTKHSKLLNKAAVETEMLVAFYTTDHGFYHVARLYSAALFEACFYVISLFLFFFFL